MGLSLSLEERKASVPSSPLRCKEVRSISVRQGEIRYAGNLPGL